MRKRSYGGSVDRRSTVNVRPYNRRWPLGRKPCSVHVGGHNRGLSSTGRTDRIDYGTSVARDEVRYPSKEKIQHKTRPVPKTRPAQEKVKRYSELPRFEARYLFHGTSADYEPSDVGIDPLMGGQSTAYVKATERRGGLVKDWHGVKSPAVWVSDRIGGARFYANDPRSSRTKPGRIYVIDSKKLKDDRVYFGGSGGDYVDDNGDYHSHNEFAFAGKIPPEAIVDSADASSPQDVERLVSEYEDE